jgi:hypothetical protein
MACKTQNGIEFICTSLLKVGGVFPDFWVGYLSELDTPISIDQTADISQIDFGAYGGLRKFSGNKFAHSGGTELVVSAGGNKSYRHVFVAKLIADSTEDDVTLQDLSLGNDIFIVYQDNNRVFKILGAGSGLSVESDAENTGTTGDSDTSDTVTLGGQELTKSLRFSLGGGYAATLAYLQSREI